jgi:hypothetical protein
MTAPVLQWYDETGTTQNPTLAFTPDNGTPGAEQTLRLYNDKDSSYAADTAPDVLITVLTRDGGSSDPFTATHSLAASGWIEARAVDASGAGIIVQVTPWTAVGGGRFLATREIPSDCYRSIEFRPNIPGGAGTVASEALARAYHSGESTVMEDGTYASGVQGIVCGLGDGATTGILDGGALTEAGTPDNTVEVADVSWEHLGEPQTLLAHALTFNDEDSAAAALASGEAYPATLSLGAGPTVTVTKGVKGTAPLDVTDWPEPPAGEAFLGRVNVPFDATIETADIDQTDRLFTGFAWESDGLEFYVHGGVAIIGGRLVRKSSRLSVTLDASDTSWVWGHPDRTISATLTEAAPVPGALLHYEVTTDGSGVTGVVDRRTWIGPNLFVLTLHKDGTLAASGKAYGALPRNSKAYLLPLSVFAALGDPGATSGSTILDVEYSEDGAAWASIYTTAAAGQLPEIAFGASVPVDLDSRPEVLTFRGGTRFRLNVVQVPGTASTDAFVALLFVFPGN